MKVSARFLLISLAGVVVAWLVLGSVHRGRSASLDKLLDKIEDFSLECKRQFGPDGRMKVRGRKAFSPRVIRFGYRSPRNLCDYSERTINRFMALPRNCSRGGKRIWLQGQWMDATQMESLLAPPPAEGDDPIKCVVFCIDHVGPCPGGKCLLPLYLRRNASDAKTATQMLEMGEFDVVKPQMDLARILDGGAGIGVSSAIFATMFPEASILSMESCKEKYAMLLLNARSYPNINPLQASLWPKVTPLQPQPPAVGTGGPLVEPLGDQATGGGIPSVHGLSVEFLMIFFKMSAFDLVKLDMAGNEREFLRAGRSNPLKWLDQAKMAMVSIHDSVKRGAKDVVIKSFSDRPQWRYLGWWKKYRVYKVKGFDEGA